MKTFWIIIKDTKSKTLESIGRHTDDTVIINNIHELKKKDIPIQCCSSEIDPNLQDIHNIIEGYSYENGVYRRLLREYEEKTGVSLHP